MTATPDTTKLPGPRSGTVAVNGLDIYYELHGEGDPLVLLHGAMGTIDSCFAALLPTLAASRTVVAVELQGHGHTPDIDRPLSYALLADDVAGLMRAVGVAPADVVGYSLGGGVALQLAMTRPSLVRRIVFAGGASYRRDGLHPDMLEDPGPDIPDLTGTPWHDAYLRVAPDPAQWTTLVAKTIELDGSFEGWTADQVRAVQAPTLLVIGDADIVRPEHTVEMFRLLGGGVNGDLVGLSPSRLAILPGTTHTGVTERAGWLGEMILDFLDPPPPSTPPDMP
jgi:pimeloyl-ACP methyl ester carboxylesterase